MGHLAFLSQAHRDLVARIGRGTVALPDPEEPKAREALKEILEILFTPEEAALAARLPMFPASLETIAVRVGEKPEAILPRLERMADKALVVDLPTKDGGTQWMLSPPVVGFFEFSMMREGDGLPRQRLAKALHAYTEDNDAFAREVFDTETVVGRTLVREETLEEEDLAEVLDWERATMLIAGASAISVSLCYCRHEAEHLGERCDFPLETCMTLGRAAERVVRRGYGRAIERAEALDILQMAKDKGLVQIGDNVQRNPSYLCNCCACCCGQLRSINRFDLRGVVPSRFTAITVEETCVGCARCARACPVGAITMAPRRVTAKRKNTMLAVVDEERCIGCGVCVAACNKQAKQMVPREKRPRVPENVVEYAVRRALERGRLADLLFDVGTSRGHRFLNRAVRALTQLPPAERALASEQVRSRFVRQALARVRV